MSNFPPQYAPQPTPPKKSNKKLFIILGIGCLGAIVVGIVLIAVLIGGGVYMLANSEAAQTATSFVQQSPAAKAELGEPLTCSFGGGNIESNNGAGTATITVSATGSKGSGTATVYMTSAGSEMWQVTSAALTGGPSGTTINLK
jgi:hypothetical protein